MTGEDVPGPAKKEKKKGKAVSYNKNLVKSRYFVVPLSSKIGSCLAFKLISTIVLFSMPPVCSVHQSTLAAGVCPGVIMYSQT